MKKNILFICHTGGVAGAETVMMESVKAFVDSPLYNVYVAFPADGNDALKNRLSAIGITNIKRFRFRSARSSTPMFIRNVLYGLLCALIPMIMYCRQNRIDLLYVNSSVNIMAMLVAKFLKIPYIVHIHEQSNRFHRWVPKWIDGFYRWVFTDKRATLIFVSSYSKDKWSVELGLPLMSDSIFIIHPAHSQVSRGISKNSRKSNFVFGFLGSKDRNKNVSMLIEAFVKVRTSADLIVAGPGKLSLNSKKILDSNNNITELGSVTDLSAFYGSIDALVVPSLNESWGLVALEAISCGVAVILTKETGLSDILVNNRDVLFIDPCDINTLIDAMERLCHDQDGLEQMTRCAKMTLDNFDRNNNYSSRIRYVIAHVLQS